MLYRNFSQRIYRQLAAEKAEHGGYWATEVVGKVPPAAHRRIGVQGEPGMINPFVAVVKHVILGEQTNYGDQINYHVCVGDGEQDENAFVMAPLTPVALGAGAMRQVQLIYPGYHRFEHQAELNLPPLSYIARYEGTLQVGGMPTLTPDASTVEEILRDGAPR